MNKKTLLAFNKIIDATQVKIIKAHKTGVAAEVIHFSTMLDLLTLVLDRIDEIEERVGILKPEDKIA